MFNQTLAKLLKDQVLVSPAVDGSVFLRERKANMNVEVLNSMCALIVVNVKRLNHLSMLEDGESKKICDYLLIATFDGKIRAGFVELKKSLTGEVDPMEQLRRSLPVLEYLRSACEVECEKKGWGAGMTVKYNLIAEKRHRRIDKQRVRQLPGYWPEIESYKNIAVRKFVGSRIAISKLL